MPIIRSADFIDYDRLAEAIVNAGARISDRNYNLTINTLAPYEPLARDFAILESQSEVGT